MTLTLEQKAERYEAQQEKQREYHKTRNALIAKLVAFNNSPEAQDDEVFQAFMES